VCRGTSCAGVKKAKTYHSTSKIGFRKCPKLNIINDAVLNKVGFKYGFVQLHTMVPAATKLSY
jgi:uncharacterized protein YjdB